MRKTGIILFGLIITMLVSSCSEFQQVQKSQDVDEKYASAISYYDKGDYYRAGLLFEELIPLFIGRKEAELSQFYYAYCHYHQNQLSLANYYFDHFATTFPRSEKTEEALYMKCKSIYYQTPKSNLEQNSTLDALEAIQIFTNRYPKSEFVEKCNDMVDKLNFKLERKEYDNAKLYLKLRYYKAAVIAFDNFVKTFPGSKDLEEIYLLKVEAQASLAEISVIEKQKERYDKAVLFYQNYVDKFPNGTMLNKADQLYSQILSNLGRVTSKEELNRFEATKDIFNRKRYQLTISRTDVFAQDFPGSKYLEELSYMRFNSQYNVATQSESKDKKRILLERAVEYYNDYKTRFPASKSLKKVETVYTRTLDALKKLENTNN